MSVNLIMLLPLAAVFLTGVFLIRAGLLVRRRGETPHCRNCDYNLTGIESDRCPECGAELGPGGVVRGERYRRPGLMVVGLILALVPAVPLLKPVRQYNWYRLRPTAWVLSDLQSANAPVANKAWKELQRRESLGKLSSAQLDNLVTVCLAEQARSPEGPILEKLVDYLGDAYQAGKLSPAQEARFFEQMFDFGLEFRRGVTAGHQVPVDLVEQRCGPSGWYPPPLWAQIDCKGLIVDGKQTDVLTCSYNGGFSGRGTSRMGGWLTCNEAGTHKATATVEVRIYSGPIHKADQSTQRHRHVVEVRGQFETVDSEPPDYIRLVTAPDMKDRLTDCMRIHPIRHHPNRHLLETTVHFDEVPISIAFEVFARICGQEYRMGNIRLAKGKSTGFGIHGEYNGPPFDACEVILRSSKQAARRSIDLFEIWDGQLVSKDVPVRQAAGRQ